MKKRLAPPLWSRDQIVSFLQREDFTPFYDWANAVNQAIHGDFIEIRAIVEFSNVCKRTCHYCGLRYPNRNIERYRMSETEILDTAYSAADAGYRTLVMQSGEADDISISALGRIIRQIKTDTEMAVTVSCGEKTEAEYRYLRECGADRYLLKHETSDAEIYGRLHDGDSLEKRLQCLRTLKRLGYETGGGFMIGLPGQTLEIIADDILLLAELPCDMAGIGPFLPHPDTPLGESAPGSAELTKRAVALTRILLPYANLPVTTALGVLQKKESNAIFDCGANVIMRKVTPQKYEDCYNIYPNQIEVGEIVRKRKELEAEIRGLGKIPR